MKTKISTGKQGGFTLIELMLVMTILVALFIVFLGDNKGQDALDSTKELAYRSDIAQIQAAINIVHGDDNGYGTGELLGESSEVVDALPDGLQDLMNPWGQKYSATGKTSSFTITSAMPQAIAERLQHTYNADEVAGDSLTINLGHPMAGG